MDKEQLILKLDEEDDKITNELDYSYINNISITQNKVDLAFKTLIEGFDEALYVIPKYQRKYIWKIRKNNRKLYKSFKLLLKNYYFNASFCAYVFVLPSVPIYLSLNCCNILTNHIFNFTIYLVIQSMRGAL